MAEAVAVWAVVVAAGSGERLGAEHPKAFVAFGDNPLVAASVSALVFANECASYFQVGKVCKDQMVDYAARKGQSLEVTEKWMGPYLGYDSDAK